MVDEGLATRVRDLIGHEHGLSEKKMFGGLAMLLDGHGCAEDDDLKRWVDRGTAHARSLPPK